MQILLVLQDQPFSASVLVSSAEQPYDVSVGNIRALLLPPGGGQLIKDNPAVDSETPRKRVMKTMWDIERWRCFLPVEIHRLRRVIFVGALSVPAETLTESVGCEDVRAGQTRHLCWPGLGWHSGVKILTGTKHYLAGKSLTKVSPEQQFWCPNPSSAVLSPRSDWLSHLLLPPAPPPGSGNSLALLRPCGLKQSFYYFY